MTKYCNCPNPDIQIKDNIGDSRGVCMNCGLAPFVQFSKNSENGKYTGNVVVGKRGYFIAVTDGEVTHRLKQKEVKSLEEQTGVSGQELADLVASRTTRLSYSYNGKYGSSSISYGNLPMTEEYKKTKEEKNKEWEKNDKIKKKEDEKKEDEKKEEKEGNKKREEKILKSLNKKLKIILKIKEEKGREWGTTSLSFSSKECEIDGVTHGLHDFCKFHNFSLSGGFKRLIISPYTFFKKAEEKIEKWTIQRLGDIELSYYYDESLTVEEIMEEAIQKLQKSIFTKEEVKKTEQKKEGEKKEVDKQCFEDFLKTKKAIGVGRKLLRILTEFDIGKIESARKKQAERYSAIRKMFNIFSKEEIEEKIKKAGRHEKGDLVRFCYSI